MQDIERNYTGTNFAVITLIVLLVGVGVYLLVAQGKDIADDGPMDVRKEMRINSDTGQLPASEPTVQD